jgi:hypothetical protein
VPPQTKLLIKFSHEVAKHEWAVGTIGVNKFVSDKFLDVVLPLFLFTPLSRGVQAYRQAPGGVPKCPPPIIAGLSGVRGARTEVSSRLAPGTRVHDPGHPPPLRSMAKVPIEKTALVKPG